MFRCCRTIHLNIFHYFQPDEKIYWEAKINSDYRDTELIQKSQKLYLSQTKNIFHKR